MEELLETQSQIGYDIERMLKNFKKDPKSRKTPAYLQTKLNLLNTQWKIFEENHAKILNSDDTETPKEYFHNNFYQEVAERKEALVKLISEMSIPPEKSNNIPVTEDNTAGGTNSGNEGQKKNHNQFSFQENEKVYRLVNRQKGLMRNITHFLQNIEASITHEQPIDFYLYKQELLQQYATDVRQIDQEIWENGQDDQPLDYTAT